MAGINIEITRAGDHYFAHAEFFVKEEERSNLNFSQAPLSLFLLDARWGSHLGEKHEPRRSMTIGSGTLSSIAELFKQFHSAEAAPVTARVRAKKSWARSPIARGD